MHMVRTIDALVFLSLFMSVAGHALSQDPRLKTVPVTERIFMLQGRGGNIGLCIGEDGAFLIDDQFAPMVPQIKAAVARHSKTPVRFLVNTHFHGDHTGGNERLGTAGALIYAHDNVRKRMTADQLRKNLRKTASAALPVVTFDKALTFHWNGEEIHVFHVEHAHTDGDAIIHFKKANVFHTGDVMFNGLFPYIDLSSGGSIRGLIAAVEKVLALTDDESKIIPGHGDLATRLDLQAYRDMLVSVKTGVAQLVAKGKTEQEVVAAKPAKEYAAKWTWGFITPDKFVRAIYQSLKKPPARRPGAKGKPR